MLDFHQKRKLRNIANSRVTHAVLLVVVTFLLWNAFERYTVAKVMQERRNDIEQVAESLKIQKDALKAQVRYLQDERGIEAEIRRQFDVALPGEEVVVIIEDEVPAVVLPLSTTTPERSWWRLW